MQISSLIVSGFSHVNSEGKNVYMNIENHKKVKSEKCHFKGIIRFWWNKWRENCSIKIFLFVWDGKTFRFHLLHSAEWPVFGLHIKKICNLTSQRQLSIQTCELISLCFPHTFSKVNQLWKNMTFTCSTFDKTFEYKKKHNHMREVINEATSNSYYQNSQTSLHAPLLPLMRKQTTWKKNYLKTESKCGKGSKNVFLQLQSVVTHPMQMRLFTLIWYQCENHSIDMR